jgi:hypothetical protein
MRDPDFRRSQEAGIWRPHVAPINTLVDALREEGRGWAPYVAPLYGGIAAEMLSVLRDPGHMTNGADRGSGFLCLENGDASAELYATLLAEAGISADRMTPWNAYPWYINRKPNASELRAGIRPLRSLIDLLPRLKVITLHGRDAQVLWDKFRDMYPGVAERYIALRTYHTSRQAFIGTHDVREARMKNLRAAFATADRVLGEGAQVVFDERDVL